MRMHKGHSMFINTKIISILIAVCSISIIFLTTGCLDNGDDNEGETGVSAVSLMIIAQQEKNDHNGDLELVVVTAMEPTSKGRSLSWKFAYNDVTAGIPLDSFLVTVDKDGEIVTSEDDPLQKSPIKNWSIDSTTAYVNARDRLIDDGVISNSTMISVRFLYLLGEDNDNNGCEWTVGMILGSDEPLEATIRVDGSSGEVLEIISSKG
jgi:hypothetical protein